MYSSVKLVSDTRNGYFKSHLAVHKQFYLFCLMLLMRLLSRHWGVNVLPLFNIVYISLLPSGIKTDLKDRYHFRLTVCVSINNNQKVLHFTRFALNNTLKIIFSRAETYEVHCFKLILLYSGLHLNLKFIKLNKHVILTNERVNRGMQLNMLCTFVKALWLHLQKGWTFSA